MNDKNILEQAFASTNVQAFSFTVRAKETSVNFDAYREINGGTFFEAPPWEHPFYGIPTTHGGKVCGAYQYLGTTWKEEAERWGLTDFSPHNQDLGFVARLIYRKALDAVLQGRFDEAVTLCRQEWTSLPAASESRKDWTLDKARALYISYGGRLSPASGTSTASPVVKDVPTPPSVTVAPVPQKEEKKMPILALLATFGPILANLIPQVAKLLNPAPSEVAGRNIALAQTVVDTIVSASGSTDVQEAVSKMTASGTGAALVEEVKKAVVTHPEVIRYLDVSGIPDARIADVKATQAEKPFWYSPNIWVALFLYFLIVYTLIMVLSGGAAVSPDTKSMVIGFIFGTGFASLVAYYFGTTQQSAKKDETIAASVPSAS